MLIPHDETAAYAHAGQVMRLEHGALLDRHHNGDLRDRQSLPSRCRGGGDCDDIALFVGLIVHLRGNRPRTAKDHEVTNKTTIIDGLGGSI
jgi:hypothetical protein